jgi:Domain of unknown function (DUF4190)/zinc-ribbon domain
VKFCENCGQGNQKDASFCSNCGKQLAEAEEPKIEAGAGMPPEQEATQAQSSPGTPPPPLTPATAPPPGPPPPGYPAGPVPYYQPAPPPDGLAIASLVLAVASFFACPVIGAVLGLVFGYIAVRNIRESNGALGGEPLAKAGIIISWVHIGMVVLIALFITIVVLIAAVSH